MKTQLSIRRDYMPDWGAIEGLRELAQNWLDANDNDAGTIETDGDSAETVRFVNPGATLSREALLLGTTNKRGTEKRGQFGEGLKLGTLALIRAGRSVVIEAGGERWTASLEPSEAFGGAEVLTWTIEPSEVPHVEVRVGGLEWFEWDHARGLFRAFTDIGTVIETDKGSILLDPAQQGRVYVRGIFVARFEDLEFGYDLVTARVDRDRRLMSAFDVKWETSRLVEAATATRQIEAARVLQAAMTEGWDTEYLSSSISIEARNELAGAFRGAHGDRAVPVRTGEEQQRVARYGYHGVIVPEDLANVLRPVVGDANRVVENARRTLHTVYSREDLTPEEVWTLDWITAQVRTAAPAWTDACPVRVGDFADPDARALHIPKDYNRESSITLARWTLTDRYAALASLVRMVSSEIDRSHSPDMAEAIWTNLARFWHGAIVTTPAAEPSPAEECA